MKSFKRLIACFVAAVTMAVCMIGFGVSADTTNSAENDTVVVDELVRSYTYTLPFSISYATILNPETSSDFVVSYASRVKIRFYANGPADWDIIRKSDGVSVYSFYTPIGAPASTLETTTPYNISAGTYYLRVKPSSTNPSSYVSGYATIHYN